MIKKTLTILLMMLSFSAAASDLKTAAEEAMMNGDAELALQHYMDILAMNPGDRESLDVAIILAEEIGVPEIAVELLLDDIRQLIANSDKATVQGDLQRLGELHAAVPQWINEIFAVATSVFGDWGGKMLIAAAVISIYSTLSGDLLGAPRMIFASALDNNLPSVFGKVHPKYKTPYIAIIFYAIIIGVFALSGTFKYLAFVATGSILLVDLGVSLAVIRLRQRDGLPKEGQFRLPFGPLIPFLSCAIVGWLLLQMPLDEAVSIAIMIGACVAFYAIRSVLRGRQNTAQTPVDPGES